MTDVGELYPMGITVRDPAGDMINAASVTLAITRPEQVVESPAIANPPGETGQYVYDYVPAQPGPYVYRWQTMSPTLVLEGSFDANPVGSVGLISLARAKAVLRLDRNDTEEDDRLRGTIRSATAVAEDARNEIIMRRPMFETHRLRRPRRRLTLMTRPIISLTRVVMLDNGSSILPPHVDVDEHGIVETTSGYFAGRVHVEFVAGYAIVPENYREAVEYIVQHMWQNKGGGSGRPRVGGQAADDEPSGMGYSIPNRARDLLGHAGPLVG